jgi:voltage-gated sodium channel
MNRIGKVFLNDLFIFYLIVANALLIFIQEFKVHNTFTTVAEISFTTLFVIELLIKLHTYGINGYLSSKWNRLDFILILISIPSLASFLFSSSLLSLNFLLTLRVFRVFKFFRLIRFFPEVNQMIAGVQRAIKASYVVFIGYFAIVFIFSVLSCSLFKNVAPEYFEDPLKSFYSIFRLFSIEGWYEIPDLIASRTNSFIGLMSVIYFMVLLLCGGILGLSIVNSIFVDAMVSDNNDQLQEQVQNIEKKIDQISDSIERLNKINNN